MLKITFCLPRHNNKKDLSINLSDLTAKGGHERGGVGVGGGGPYVLNKSFVILYRV